MDLILAGRELAPRARFIALGAGNCNDLELARLVDAFAEVHLADIDPGALRAAVERQGVADAPGLRLHAPLDLTGMAEIVSSWKSPTPADVRAAVDASERAPIPAELGQAFDVVLSSCVLSQLVGYATDALGGDNHPAFRELVVAIRARHLRLMLELLAPGGTGLLVCDLVSSDSLTQLPRVAEHELPGLIEKLARDRHFFSGLYPDALLDACRRQPLLGEVKLLSPWLWKLGPRRTFLVYALRLRRCSGEQPLYPLAYPP
jgi:hypothetical protein